MLLWTKSASPVWNNERIPLCRALRTDPPRSQKIGLNTQEFLSDGWFISYVCDPAKGSVLKMGHGIINAIWRHQLFFCRNDIGSGKKDLMSHSSSMFDHTVHKKGDSQQIINLFHISLFQFLTDKCTADLSAAFHFFRNNIHSKAKLPSHSLQKLWCSLAFIPEPESSPTATCSA